MGTVLKNNNNTAYSNACNTEKNYIIGKWWQVDKKD